MRVIVWGLGYVGTVSAACLAQVGHDVIGIETNKTKVEAINVGHCAIKEPGLDNLIAMAVSQGRLRATQDGSSLVHCADVSLICVGTPSAADGGPSLEYVHRVAADIGRELRGSHGYHVVVLRSTVFPGTVRGVVKSLLEEHSQKKAGEDFGLVANPEFLREGSAVDDFFAPPYTIIGELDARSGKRVEALYRGIIAPVHRVSLEAAEMLKLTNNAFHALKAGFANEIGRMCERVNLDSHEVMNLVCADAKLNISAAYLRPGFAFGGSCLPKDLRSLEFHARRLGVQIPILQSVLPSNRLQVEAARVKIHDLGVKCVGILGLSFKAGTDDLRESPVINLIRDLWQDGVDVLVHDPDVNPATMLGSNREYLERQLPQIDRILKRDLASMLAACQAVVVTQKRPEFVRALQGLNGSAKVLDLVRLGKEPRLESVASYQGISW